MVVSLWVTPEVFTGRVSTVARGSTRVSEKGDTCGNGPFCLHVKSLVLGFSILGEYVCVKGNLEHVVCEFLVGK